MISRPVRNGRSSYLTRAIESAGLKSDDAERIATDPRAWLPMAAARATRGYDAIQQNVATKADLRELGQRFEVRFANLEHRIHQMVVRLGALVVIAAGLLFAALQRWPPH